MIESGCHQSLRLKNFTVFQDASLEFAPGINAIIGENGSGKTHLLKALYAFQRPPSREVPDIRTALGQLFQTKDITELVRSQARRGDVLEVSGTYSGSAWAYALQKTNGEPTLSTFGKVEMGRPVFLPALDMMGHTLQFNQAYNQVYLDFDLTCYDIVTLLTLENRVQPGHKKEAEGLTSLLGGKLEFEEGRFYLQTPGGRQAMPLVAEGLRKIAALARLQQNGWLVPGATLFWDEPEVNVNPVLMDNIVEALLALARQGVQVFLTTHSYVILKELDLQATPEDTVRFFSLHASKAGTQVTTSESLNALSPNAILSHFGSLYDRDIRRAAGRSRRSEKVR